MLIEVTTPQKPTAKEGDILILNSYPYLVIRFSKEEFNVVNMVTGLPYFSNNHHIADLNTELNERDAIIYSSDEYMLTLKRRNL